MSESGWSNEEFCVAMREENKGHSRRRTLAEIRVRVTLCATSSAITYSILRAIFSAAVIQAVSAYSPEKCRVNLSRLR